jgi:succinoglycan biosynthesis protein ExoO
MTPEVSVIISAYNTEAYIAKAIESVLEQTMENLEIIVIDNGSKDATGKVAKSFADKRLKVIEIPENIGVGGARNLATRVAKGKWIAPLDSDDWYTPERLEKLLQIASTFCADMIADDLYLIRDGENSPWSTLLSESGEQIDKIMLLNPIFFAETDRYGQKGLHLGITKPIIKRDFLIEHRIEYDETIKAVDLDFWFAMKCLVSGARFVLVPEPFYFLRGRAGSAMTASKVDRLCKSCQAALEFLQQEDVQKNPELVRVVSENLRVFQKNLAYYSVVEPLKQRRFLAALIAMLRNPYFFVHFLLRLPNILSRRMEYYLFANRYAYDMMYQGTKKQYS